MAASAQAEPVPTISALIKARMDEDSVSARQLSKLAADAGHSIDHNTISRLVARPPKRWPEPDTIRALAFITRSTDRGVLLAFGRSFGLQVESVSFADMVPAGFGAAPAEVQQAAWRLLHAISSTMSDSDRTGPVPSVPQRTLDNPRTIVGATSSPQTEQSDRRSTSN